MNAVQIQNLSVSFGTKRSGANGRVVLKNLNLVIHEGEIFGLLGPNGGGKTTLFRILSTQLQPSDGEATIFGHNVSKNPESVRTKIGVVFQNPSLDGKLTLYENLVTQGALFGLRGKVVQSRIEYLTHRFSLHDRLKDRVEILSGGLKRRAEIAKGLLHEPKLLLMDEPTSGIDPAARRELWTYFQELKKEGMTILLTTHILDEGDHCDRLAILHKGHVITQGSPDDLKSEIGGDVITIEAKDPKTLAQKIKDKFRHEALVVDSTLRIEIKEGHAFIPKLVEAFPGSINSVTVGKPTLEDVFIKKTGVFFTN